MQIGPYEILEKVAEGGMGIVYRVREQESGQIYALKTLKRPGKLTRQRFQREAQAMHTLRHPNVVRCVAVGEDDGDPYLVMDYVEGASLQEHLDRKGAFPLGEALEIGAALTDALQAVHAQDLLHRDLKPANVLRADDGRLLLTDFGLVKRDRPGVSKLESLTQPGSALGTPGYWSPEQARGQLALIGVPTDVYGLAGTLYGLLTSAPPRGGTTLVELVEALDKPVVPLREVVPQVPAELETLVTRGLADDPQDRPTLIQFARTLADLQPEVAAAASEPATEAPARGNPVAWVLGAVALAGMGVFASFALAPPPKRPTLEVTSPRPDAVVAGDGYVEVSGTVGCTTGWVEVSAAGVSARLDAPGGPFRLRCPVEPGPNRLRVVAYTQQGSASPTTRRQFDYTLAPPWFLALPAADRAALPLPEGVEFGEEPGDYANTTDGSLLRWIPAGSFTMGEDGGEHSNTPPHEVRFAQGFYLGKFEVTWAQFARFCEATGTPRPSQTIDLRPLGYEQTEVFAAPDTHPSLGISHDDAEAYTRWAGLRLPSEAEWEYAAGGRHDTLFSWGNAPPDASRLNIADASITWAWSSEAVAEDGYAKALWSDGYSFTAPVGAFPAGASPEGVHDLCGNANEWVADGYLDHYRGAPTDGSPRPLKPGGRGLTRGGCYDTNTFFARRTIRTRGLRSVRVPTRGFRVARSAD